MRRSSRPAGRNVSVLVLTVVFLAPFLVRAQDTGNLAVPADRYAISPFLQDSFLFVSGAGLDDRFRLDLSLGVKYLYRPWRAYLDILPGEVQIPVEHLFQFRPALTFAWRQWFDLAVVLPFSIQTAGEGSSILDVSGQEGGHFLDPELHFRVPFLHQRPAGLGLALGGSLFVPLGSQQAFAGSKTWRGAVLFLALDWRGKNLSLALNTGAWLREHGSTPTVPIEPEWLIRPAAQLRFPVGSWSLGFSLEAQLATSFYHLFSDERIDAFQLLLSVHLGPGGRGEGFHVAGGGWASALGESQGYSVPAAHAELRTGYSWQWEPEVASQADIVKPQRPAGPVARVTGLSGIIDIREGPGRSWRRVQVGQAVPPGSQLRIGPGASLAMQNPDGSRLALEGRGPEGMVSIKDEFELLLEEGELKVATEGRQYKLLFQGSGNYALLMGEAEVEVGKEGARFTMSVGEMTVFDKGRKKVVEAGKSYAMRFGPGRLERGRPTGARVQMTMGDVKVRHKGRAGWKMVVEQQEIYGDDQIQTSGKSRFALVFPDSSEVEIEGSSTLQVSELDEEFAFMAQDGQFELESRMAGHKSFPLEVPGTSDSLEVRGRSRIRITPQGAQVETLRGETVVRQGEDRRVVPAGRTFLVRVGKVEHVKFGVNLPMPGGEQTDRRPPLNHKAVDILLGHKDEFLEKIKQPGARLVFVGYADKCFIGPPYLAKKFNKELSLRRARAVRDRLRDMLGRVMDGVPVKVVGMGFACANPGCRCSTPDMPACAMDRKVEIYVEFGEEKPFRCPAGRYWMSR